MKDKASHLINTGCAQDRSATERYTINPDSVVLQFIVPLAIMSAAL